MRENRTCSLGGGRRPAPHGAPPPTRQFGFFLFARDPTGIGKHSRLVEDCPAEVSFAAPAGITANAIVVYDVPPR